MASCCQVIMKVEKKITFVQQSGKSPMLHLMLEKPWTTITKIEFDRVSDGLIDSMVTAASEAWRRPPSIRKKTWREEFWEPAVTEGWSRDTDRGFLSYFSWLIGILSFPFHYLPVIPLLLTIPLSPCKLTQRLWTLAAFSLIGSLRLKLSSDKTKVLDSYAAPS